MLIKIPVNKDKIKEIDKSVLTKKQKQLFKKIIKNHILSLKKHFKDESWDINSDSITHDILYDFFGFHLSDILIHEICGKCNVSWGLKDNTFVFKNKKQKVFYSPLKNKLYVNTCMDNVNYDIQLGNL